jgi:hypothetical protein
MKLPELLGRVAPTVATLLGGPLAGLAVEAVAEALGVSKERVEEVLTGTLGGEQIVQLKAAERAVALKLKELDIRAEELAVADRSSAREREVKRRDRTTPALAWIVILSFVVMAFGVLFGRITAESVLAGTVIGYLSAKAEQVLSYYFGSSRGSDDKNALLARMQSVRRQSPLE